MDVEYFELPDLPGKPMFRCEKRRATLQPASCASLWTAGNQKHSDDRFWLCKGCAIGALHAGVGDSTLSPIYAASICSRCGSGATRLIGGDHCISCYNREREYLKGRNARGNVPITHPVLHRLAIRYWTGGHAKTRVKPNAVDTLELVVAALRDEPKQVTFTVSPPPVRPNIPQMELFA